MAGNDNKLVTLADLGVAYTALSTTATTSANGMMSSTDKTKLDGIASGAQVNPGNATTSSDGLMSSTDKTKLEGIESGAQVNTVTGVKGAAESDYRDGNVSLDAEDVGAISKDMNYTAATLPYANTEKIALLGTDGNNYYTTIGELASQIGGGGGTTQAALVHYVKNCGSISGSGTTLNWTNSQIDNNITENMVVLKAELSNPAAQISDWTCTTTNGYVTITGTIASGSSTNALLYFGVSLSTAPSIIVNLASNNSDNVLKTNPTPGVMGVLGLSNGGTGVSASTNAGLLDSLGAVKTSDIESIKPEEYHFFNNVTEFENYINRTVGDVSFSQDGTAQANLPFTANATITIFGRAEHNIHVLCFRANGELYTRNKNTGTWDSEWVKRW